MNIILQLYSRSVVGYSDPLMVDDLSVLQSLLLHGPFPHVVLITLFFSSSCLLTYSNLLAFSVHNHTNDLRVSLRSRKLQRLVSDWAAKVSVSSRSRGPTSRVSSRSRDFRSRAHPCCKLSEVYEWLALNFKLMTDCYEKYLSAESYA
jgi:hypothetical protein